MLIRNYKSTASCTVFVYLVFIVILKKLLVPAARHAANPAAAADRSTGQTTPGAALQYVLQQP